MRVNVQDAVSIKVSLNVYDCATCGVIFGISSDFNQRRLDDGKPFYCPNGHSHAYHETKADRLQKELERANNRMAALRAEADQAWAKAAEQEKALKVAGREAKRLEKRASAGVCTQCHRHFANVESHMQSKHAGPDAAKAETKRRKKS